MINSTSKNLVKLSRLSSPDPPILDHRRSSASVLKQRKPPLHNHSNSSTTFNLTRDIPLLPQDSLTQRLNTNNSVIIHDPRQGINTERASIKSSKVGITTIANFSGILASQEKDKKKIRRAKTQVLTLARPSTSMPASFRKLGDRLSVGEVVNNENVEENKEEKETREKILKDIPRMKDMSSIMMNTMRDMKAKFRKIDSMTKLDFSQTFRSKFEEDVVAEAINKVEEYAGTANKGDKTRVVKLNCSERFIVEQDKKVVFKMRTDNVKFPLDVRIDFLPKTAQYFFEIYVSSTNTMPSLSRYDHRIVDEKEFVLRYAKHPPQLYFTLYAISEVDMKMSFSAKKEKVEEEEGANKGRKRLNHWEYFRKAMEHMRAKRVKEYEFMKYTPEQLNRFNAEVAEIKREKVLKNLALTKDGRNIVRCNMNELYSTHPDTIIAKIRNQSEDRFIRTENAQRKKEEVQNELHTRKVLLVNRVEIRREAKKAYFQIYQEEEYKKEIQRRWIATVTKQLFFQSLFEHIRAKRVEEFKIKMRNKKIARFQQAFKRHLQSRGETRLERNILNFREGLTGASNLVYKGVFELAGKALTRYVAEAGILVGMQLKTEHFYNSVLKLQRAYRRRRFRWYIRKLAVMSIILDICKDRPMDRFKAGKSPKKKKKEQKNVQLQFYSCLQSNNEFQQYVVDYILRMEKIQRVEDDKEYLKLIGADKKKKIKKKGTIIGLKKETKETKEDMKSTEQRFTKNISTLSHPLSTFSDSFVPASSRSRSRSVSSISSTSSRQSFDQKKDKPETVVQPGRKFTVEEEAVDLRTVFRMPNKATVQLFLETDGKNIVKEVLGRYSLNYFAKKPSFISYLV